jgi:hypothetical protein
MRSMEPTGPSTSEKPVEEQRLEPRVEDEPGLRFEDPYWDDAFCAWWDPTLRTCC